MHLFIPPDAKEIINKEVPYQIRSKIPSVVERGYKIAREAIKHNIFLNWQIGERHEGYLRSIAVQYAFKEEIEKGRLPFKFTYEYNSNKSHRFMMLHTSNSKITLSQVKSPFVIARPAFFRDKLQEMNQICMIFEDNEIKVFDQSEYYLLLTYSSGGEKPRFVNLGMPGNKRWIERINLMDEIHLVNSGKPKDDEEYIEPEQLVGFKKFVHEVGEGEK